MVIVNLAIGRHQLKFFKKELCRVFLGEGIFLDVLWFSFSNNVWEYSTHFENFALNNLLCILLLYTYFSYLEQVVSDGNYVQKTNKNLFHYGLILSGLALGKLSVLK